MNTRDWKGYEYDVWDIIELANGRAWVVGMMYPPSMEQRPEVLLQQVEDVELPPRPGDEWKGEAVIRKLQDTETGVIWCYPEDLPRVIERLSKTLQELRQAAEEDSDRRPRPYWGPLRGEREEPKE